MIYAPPPKGGHSADHDQGDHSNEATVEQPIVDGRLAKRIPNLGLDHFETSRRPHLLGFLGDALNPLLRRRLVTDLDAAWNVDFECVVVPMGREFTETTA